MGVVVLTRDEMLTAVLDLSATVRGRGAGWGGLGWALIILWHDVDDRNDAPALTRATEIGRRARAMTTDDVGATQVLGPGARAVDPDDPVALGLIALPDALRAMLDREQVGG